jgi:hypothetical protein
LTFAEIAVNDGGLDTSEAVALVLAVADESGRSAGTARWRAVPSSDQIGLDAHGRVSIPSDADEIDERRYVQSLAGLLESLVGVDSGSGRRGPRPPGGLLVLIARASGMMDLPVPSYDAFREALRRFGSTDALTLASVYSKCMARRPVPAVPPAQPPIALPTPAAASTLHSDYGVEAFTPSEIKRPVDVTRVGPGRARTAAAAVLAIAAMVASFAIGLNVVFPHRGTSPATTPPAAAAAQQPDTVFDARRGAATAPSPVPSATSSQPPRVSGDGISASPILSAAAIGADVFSPSFIDQGRAVLFHSGRTRSSLMRLSFDERGRPSVATVLQDGASNYHARRSPDGAWLAYDSDRDGTRAVYVAREDGRETRKVSGEGYAAVPHWSPDGRKLAFIRAEPRRPRVWNVWLADLDAHSLTRVSDHAVGQAWSASWFPGGTRLAYSVEDRLIIADLARATTRVVRSPRAGHLVRTPAVSPDGRWIMFQVHRDGVWLLQVATGRMRRVLADATAEEFEWSPDSRRVVYHTHRDGGWSLWQLAFDRPA